MAVWRSNKGGRRGTRRPSYGQRRRRRRTTTVSPLTIKRIPDLQTIDTVANGVQMSTAVNTALMFVPTRNNTNYTDRIGDQTTITSILFQCTFSRGAAQLAVTGQHVRILLFWDRQPNGAFPAGNLPLINATPTGLIDPQYTRRFKCLFDHDVCIGPSGTEVSASSSELHFKYYKKCSLVTRFIGNGGSIADIETGALILYAIGDTAITANNVPVVNYSCRCKFTM